MILFDHYMCVDVWTTVTYVWLCGSVNACCDEMSSTHQRFPGDCVKRGYLMSQSTRGQRVSLKYTQNYLSALFRIQYLIFFHLIVRNINVKTKHTLSPLLPIESVMTVVPASIWADKRKNDHRPMRCLSQCGGTVDRLSGAFVLPLWHWSHSQALLPTRPRQFLFILFFSYFSLIPYSRFQEHMSLGSALLIRGLFCLWVSLFFALVDDGIVTGVSVGVLPSRQKVFIGLLMSLPRVVSLADLHLSFSAQSEQSQISAIGASYLVSSGCLCICACPAQGHREAHYRRSMSLGSTWLFFFYSAVLYWAWGELPTVLAWFLALLGKWHVCHVTTSK